MRYISAIGSFRIALWLLPVLLLVWFLNETYVPFGRMTARFDVVRGDRRVLDFASKEPAILIGYLHDRDERDSFQVITASPVYFRVLARRPFERATVTIRYQNPDAQPEFSVGVRQRNGAYAKEPLVANHPLLNQLPRFWHRTDAGSTILWQRDRQLEAVAQQLEMNQEAELGVIDRQRSKELQSLRRTWEEGRINQKTFTDEKARIERTYEKSRAEVERRSRLPEEPRGRYVSLQDFLSNPPDASRIVQFHYELSPIFRLPEYKPREGSTVISKSIRGKHEFLTYIRDERLDFTFTIQDINRHSGADPFRLVVSGPAGRVLEQTLEDDGVTSPTGEVEPERTLRVSREGLPEGVYRFVIDIDDDVFIKRIETVQHLLVFRKNLYLAENAEYRSVLGEGPFSPTTVFVDGNHVGATTSHDAGKQALSVGASTLKLDTLLGPATKLSGLKGLTRIISPQNDVYLESDGYFSLAKEQYFNPRFSQVVELSEVPSLDPYDYIVTRYPQPVQDGVWLRASATLDATDLYFNSKKRGYEFAILLPDLAEAHRTLRIHSVEMVFTRPPITPERILTKVLQAVGLR